MERYVKAFHLTLQYKVTPEDAQLIVDLFEMFGLHDSAAEWIIVHAQTKCADPIKLALDMVLLFWQKNLLGRNHVEQRRPK